MAYRHQEFHEPCGVCAGSPTRGCARCNAPCCATHLTDYGRCASCELASFERGHATRQRVGTVIAAAVAVPAALAVVALVGVAKGFVGIPALGAAALLEWWLHRDKQRARSGGAPPELPPGPTQPTP